jgi:hypothetical protein
MFQFALSKSFAKYSHRNETLIRFSGKQSITSSTVQSSPALRAAQSASHAARPSIDSAKIPSNGFAPVAASSSRARIVFRDPHSPTRQVTTGINAFYGSMRDGGPLVAA